MTNKTIKIFYEPPFKKKYQKVLKKDYKTFYCFLSSLEDIPERRIAEKEIEKCGTWISPHTIKVICVERSGHHNSKALWKKIKDNIKMSRFFVSIISPENYSKWVEKEVKYAFSNIKNDKIVVLTRLIESGKIHKHVKKLLEFIKNKKMQYAKYDDQKFEEALTIEMRRILSPIIRKLYKSIIER